jgi:hypothetical protein
MAIVARARVGANSWQGMARLPRDASIAEVDLHGQAVDPLPG